MKRTPIIVGNWKMNTTKQEAIELASQIKENCNAIRDVEIGICPPFIHISEIAKILANSPIKWGAQNIHHQTSGAYTGDISAAMIKDLNAELVIVGHSERRQYHAEETPLIKNKLNSAFTQSLTPILCVGESKEERESNQTFTIIKQQLQSALDQTVIETLTAQNKDMIIAYEPVWAIGTGLVASPKQAQEVHAFIRNHLSETIGERKATQIRIQYGGSVKPDNIETLISQTDIDGALVGGASLNATDFSQIIKQSKNIYTKELDNA